MARNTLNEDDVLFIFREIQKGETQTLLAEDFGVVQQTISEIATGKTWSHVTGKQYVQRFRAKLTPEQVLKIDADIRAGLSNDAVSAKHNLPAGTVSQIKNGKRWAAVTGRRNRRDYK